MLSTILKRATGLGACLIILATIVSAQTSQVEGNVKVKAEDGTLKPVAGALIDIYRLDVKGKWDVKTDKSGHFIRLGLPIQGTYLFVASGPGIQPTWINSIRISQVPSVDFVANPGDGSTMTLEQVQAAIKGGGQQAAAAPAGKTVSAADKAKMEAQQKEYDAKLKEGKELQANFDAARNHYNAGIELTKATPPNYAAALSEFEQATAVDPGKHAAMAELAYKANANLAESHYQVGVDMFNKKDRAGAKPHFEKAVESANKAIALASSAPPENANASNDLLIYYNILAKNAQLLVEYYGAVNLIDDTIKVLDKAASMDTVNKNKWSIAKADMFRSAGRTDDAVAAYKAVLAADPNHADAMYGLGLTLIASSEKEREKIQEGADMLALFVSKAPATDKRVPIVKEALEGVKAAYKIEAEKPSSKGRRRP